MATHEKLLQKIQTKPVPSDIRWNELSALLERLGYVMIKGSGSRRKFYNRERDALISLHEPHPEPVIGKAALGEVVDHLKLYEFI